MKDRFYLSTFLLAIISAMSLTNCEDGNDIYLRSAVVSIEQEGEIADDHFIIRFSPNPETSKFEYYLGTESDYPDFLSGKLNVEISNENRMVVQTFSELSPNTTYTVFARAYDQSDTPGTVTKLSIRTKERGESVTQPEMEIQYIGISSVVIQLSLPEDNSSFRYYIGIESERESFKNGTISGEVFKEKTNATIQKFDLFPDTEYRLYVIAVDRSNQSGFFEFAFKTYNSDEWGDVSIALTYSDYFVTKCRFTPNDKCGKIDVMMSLKGQYDYVFEHFNDIAQTINFLKSEGLAVSSTTDLEHQLITPQMLNEQPLDIYVVIYDQAGETPVSIKYNEIRTPPVDMYDEWPGVWITVKDITSTQATYVFSTEDTNMFIFDAIVADLYDEMRADEYWWHPYLIHETK